MNFLITMMVLLHRLLHVCFSNLHIYTGRYATQGIKCSNTPVLCCACDVTPTFVWKYDMVNHWQEEHKELLDSGLVSIQCLLGQPVVTLPITAQSSACKHLSVPQS